MIKLGAGGQFRESVGCRFPDLCQSVTSQSVIALGQNFDVCAACTIFSVASRKTDRQAGASNSTRLTGAGRFCALYPCWLLKLLFFVPEAILLPREAKPG